MSRIIDLTHPLEHGQGTFPLDPKLSIVVHNTVASIGYNITQICMSTHQGTHLDVPYHFFDDGKTIDQVPLDKMYGRARLIRIPKLAGEDITVDDFLPFERHFTAGAKIIYETGHHRHFGESDFYSNMPSMTADAAKWIASKKLDMLGMDTPTPGKEYDPIHKALLAPGVETIVVEALANLDQCPDSFVFVGFPLLLKGRDGSPIRAAAIVD